MPDASKIAMLKEAIAAKHSLLVDCYCMVDGLKLHLQQSGDSVIQSRFYNGWKHDHFVTNIFAFAPNGSIIACTLNAPGTWHHSTLAHWGSMYSKLQKCWEEHHGKVLMDSAFASNIDRIPSTTPGAEPPRGTKDSGSARSHSTHLETSSQKRP